MMRNCSESNRWIGVVVAILLGFALSANAQSGQVFFQVTTFGIFGLASNQIARLNVLNPGNSNGQQTVVCSAQMAFMDDQGRELKSSNSQVDWVRLSLSKWPTVNSKRGHFG